MNKETGGLAFPLVCEAHEHVIETGMTLRDYFAAKAMQGQLANPDCVPLYELNDSGFVNLAKDAYKMADAMLEARK